MTTQQFLNALYENIYCDNIKDLIDLLLEYRDLNVELSECINFLNRFNKVEVKSDKMVVGITGSGGSGVKKPNNRNDCCTILMLYS